MTIFQPQCVEDSKWHPPMNGCQAICPLSFPIMKMALHNQSNWCSCHHCAVPSSQECAHTPWKDSTHQTSKSCCKPLSPWVWGFSCSMHIKAFHWVDRWNFRTLAKLLFQNWFPFSCLLWLWFVSYMTREYQPGKLQTIICSHWKHLNKIASTC